MACDAGPASQPNTRTGLRRITGTAHRLAEFVNHFATACFINERQQRSGGEFDWAASGVVGVSVGKDTDGQLAAVRIFIKDSRELRSVFRLCESSAARWYLPKGLRVSVHVQTGHCNTPFCAFEPPFTWGGKYLECVFTRYCAIIGASQEVILAGELEVMDS